MSAEGQDNTTAWIPRYIDAPITLLFWDIDVFIPAAFLIVFGVYSGWFWSSILAAITYLWGVSRFKKKLARGVMDNVFHVLCLNPYRGYPSSFQNHFKE